MKPPDPADGVEFVGFLHQGQAGQQVAVAVPGQPGQVLAGLLGLISGLGVLALEAVGAGEPEAAAGPVQAFDVGLLEVVAVGGRGQVQAVGQGEGDVLSRPVPGQGQAFQAQAFVVGEPEMVADAGHGREAVTQGLLLAGGGSERQGQSLDGIHAGISQRKGPRGAGLGGRGEGVRA
jgi:hypothetical protein